MGVIFMGVLGFRGDVDSIQSVVSVIVQGMKKDLCYPSFLLFLPSPLLSCFQQLTTFNFQLTTTIPDSQPNSHPPPPEAALIPRITASCTMNINRLGTVFRCVGCCGYVSSM